MVQFSDELRGSVGEEVIVSDSMLSKTPRGGKGIITHVGPDEQWAEVAFDDGRTAQVGYGRITFVNEEGT